MMMTYDSSNFASRNQWNGPQINKLYKTDPPKSGYSNSTKLKIFQKYFKNGWKVVKKLFKNGSKMVHKLFKNGSEMVQK